MILRDDLRSQWHERREAIRARFDMTGYALRHFGGTLKLVNTKRSEYRLTGMSHGGFVINEEDKTWYIHEAQIGGDCFALVAYALYGDTDTGSHRFKDIMQAAADHAGVDLPEYQRQKPPAASTGQPATPATYTYVDEDGRPVHRTQRFYVDGAKRFSQEYCQPDGTWRKSASEGQRYVLYRLPEVEKARAEKSTIFLCEGERDADNLRAAGLCATTMAMGSGKYREEYASQLAGAHVAILPDNDRAGVAGAHSIADKLKGACASVKIVYLPDLTKKGQDVTDWLALPTASADALMRLVLATEEHQLPPAPDASSASTPKRQRAQTAMAAEAYRGTDTAMGMRLVHMHGDHIRWLARSRFWLFWNGKYWQEDTTGVLQRMTVSVIRELDDEAAQESDTDRRNALRKMAIRAESMARRNAMIEAAKSEDGIAISESELDSARHLINVQNGIIDLRSGTLHQHAPGYYQTNIVDIDYKPGSPCARWLQFLEEIFDSDQDLIDYMQEVIGYMLSGETKQEQFWFFYGTGKNGKSTLLQVLAGIAGSYATSIPVNTIMSSERSTVPYELADMAGKRIVITSELPRARKMSTETVKSIAGKDRISAQRKYGQPFVFDPTHKLIMAGNEKPIIKDPTFGIWRKLALVPFDQSFEGREDHQLEEVLMNEREGILAWAIEGAKRWYSRMHLQEPRAVSSARNEYRAEEDDLADFINDHCVSIPGIITLQSKLYDQYKAWATENGYNVLTSNRFGRELEARGYKKANGTGGQRARLDIGLKAREDEDAPATPASEQGERYARSEQGERQPEALTSAEASTLQAHIASHGDLFVATSEHGAHLVDEADMPIIPRVFANEEAAWLALAAIGVLQQEHAE